MQMKSFAAQPASRSKPNRVESLQQWGICYRNKRRYKPVCFTEESHRRTIRVQLQKLAELDAKSFRDFNFGEANMWVACLRVS